MGDYKQISLENKKQAKDSHYLHSFLIMLKVLINIICQYKVAADISIGKEELQLSVFAENVIIKHM